MVCSLSSHLSILALPLEAEAFAFHSFWQIFNVVHAMHLKQPVEFCGPRLARALRDLNQRWCFRCNGTPFVQFLAEEIRFIGKKNLSTLNLPQIKTLRLSLISGGEDGIAVRCDVIPEILRVVDNLLKQFLFLWLEWEAGNLIIPVDQILKLRPCSIAWDLDSPVADGARVLIFLLDLATGDL